MSRDIRHALIRACHTYPPLLVALITSANGADGTTGKPVPEPIWRSLPATKSPTARDKLSIPTYRGGEFRAFHVRGRFAYLIRPTTMVDRQKRWVWIFPFEHALADANGHVQHGFYVEKLLAAGFHVAGIGVGVSCGSPAAADVCHEFYRTLVRDHGLNPRARLLAQSNGGLVAYAWAFRHAECVDRIAGIYPACDIRAWPGLDKLLVYPTEGLAYTATPVQLTRDVAKFNPIDNLAPLAQSGVKILHLQGDQDRLVTLQAHSGELLARYKKLGGSGNLIVIKGFAHGGRPFFESSSLADFLLAD